MAAVEAVLNVPSHATLSGSNRKSYIVPVGTHEIHLYVQTAAVRYDLAASETDLDGTTPPADAYFTRPTSGAYADTPIVLGPLTRARIAAGETFYFSVVGNTAAVEIAFMGMGGL